MGAVGEGGHGKGGSEGSGLGVAARAVAGGEGEWRRGHGSTGGWHVDVDGGDSGGDVDGDDEHDGGGGWPARAAEGSAHRVAAEGGSTGSCGEAARAAAAACLRWPLRGRTGRRPPPGSSAATGFETGAQGPRRAAPCRSSPKGLSSRQTLLFRPMTAASCLMNSASSAV